jgi:hypothetical protein
MTEHGARDLTAAERVELGRKVRFVPRLVRYGPGRWELTVRPSRQVVVQLYGSLRAVLGAVLPAVRTARRWERSW